MADGSNPEIALPAEAAVNRWLGKRLLLLLLLPLHNKYRWLSKAIRRNERKNFRQFPLNATQVYDAAVHSLADRRRFIMAD